MGKLIDHYRGKAKKPLVGPRHIDQTISRDVEGTIQRPQVKHDAETVYMPTPREVVADRYRLILEHIRQVNEGKLPDPMSPITALERIPHDSVRTFLEAMIARTNYTMFGSFLMNVLTILGQAPSLEFLAQSAQNKYPDGVPAGISVSDVIESCLPESHRRGSFDFAFENGFTDGAELIEYVTRLFAMPDENEDD